VAGDAGDQGGYLAAMITYRVRLSFSPAASADHCVSGPTTGIKLVVLLQEAFRHCKAIAAWGDGATVLKAARIPPRDRAFRWPTTSATPSPQPGGGARAAPCMGPSRVGHGLGGSPARWPTGTGHTERPEWPWVGYAAHHLRTTWTEDRSRCVISRVAGIPSST